MSDNERSAEQLLANCYSKPDVDPDLSDLLQHTDTANDAELAELIEQDGRHRLARGLPITLERYFNAVPDLMQRSDSLDAAIDVTLRSMSRSGRVDENSVETLVQSYPELEVAIREAAALTNALWSTSRVQEHLGQTAPRDLPQDFGPSMDNGQPRYLLRTLLGSGAFGHVYQAVDRQLSEDDHPALVAVKVLSSRNRTAWSRQRLVEEATKARRIDHPNVVRVLDRGVSIDDEDFIVYELVDGGDLALWLDKQTSAIEPEEAAKLVALIARGVQAAHAAGLVHCDLKPGNVMLSADGTPKVADFGVAIRASDALRTTNQDGGVRGPVGNLAYISPEQFRMDEGALNVPSDVYALGGMLYTLLTGELPNGSTLEEISQHHDPEHGRTVPPSPRASRPEIDRDLDAICRRAMAVRAEDRYSSAGSFADDLDAWRRREPLYWTKPSVWRLVALWSRRKPALALFSILLAVSILIGTGGAFHFSRQAAIANAEREIERIRAEEEELRNIMVNRKLAEAMVQIRNAIADSRAVMDMFPATWAIELVTDRNLLGSVHMDEQLFDIRFWTVERLIQDAEAKGRENDLETWMWRATLAYWQVAQQSPDAEPLLVALLEYWPERLDPDDVFLGHLRAMHAAAVVNRYTRHVKDGTLTRAEARRSQELSAARMTMVDWEEYCRVQGLPISIRRLLLECMVELFSPAVLDDPQAFEKARQREQEVRDIDAIGLKSRRTKRR